MNLDDKVGAGGLFDIRVGVMFRHLGGAALLVVGRVQYFQARYRKCRIQVHSVPVAVLVQSATSTRSRTMIRRIDGCQLVESCFRFA